MANPEPQGPPTPVPALSSYVHEKPRRWQLWHALRRPSQRTFLSRQGTQVLERRFGGVVVFSPVVSLPFAVASVEDSATGERLLMMCPPPFTEPRYAANSPDSPCIAG